jgi:very-short-patch-repair endonuclease
MPLPYDKNKIGKAKELRKNMTYQEKKLWYQFLSKHSIRFQRQKVIGGFIADFYCAQALLVIKVDGLQHHTAYGSAYDEDRTRILRKYNLSILRLSIEDIENHFVDVCVRIEENIQTRITEHSKLSESHTKGSSPEKNDEEA